MWCRATHLGWLLWIIQFACTVKSLSQLRVEIFPTFWWVIGVICMEVMQRQLNQTKESWLSYLISLISGIMQLNLVSFFASKFISWSLQHSLLFGACLSWRKDVHLFGLFVSIKLTIDWILLHALGELTPKCFLIGA